MAATRQPPSFLSLPLEIRCHIYSYLLHSAEPSSGAISTTGLHVQPLTTCMPDYHLYETNAAALAAGLPEHVLHVRNAMPPRTPANSRRTWYKIRSDRFRARCMDATYTVTNLPGDLHVAVLRVSRQVHFEAAPLLYSRYSFDFDTHVEACAPLLADLTPRARASIRRVGVVKRALPYDKEFDRAEWSAMCRCLGTQLTRLARLSLGVVAGKPGAVGWDGVPRFPKEDFGVLCDRVEEMEWVRHVMAIKGLDAIDVRACVEHCPPPVSHAMGFFVAFSASIEEGFAQYLTERMLVPAV